MIKRMSVSDYIKSAKRSDYEISFYASLDRLSPYLLIGIELEHRFHPVRRWRLDFSWPDIKVAVEVDGGQFKALGGRHNTDADREKINTAVSMGWSVLRFSGTQVNTNPRLCIDTLIATISTSKTLQM